MVDAVGIEPTTCRLRVRVRHFVRFYFSLPYCPIVNGLRAVFAHDLYRRFSSISRESPHKIPHSKLRNCPRFQCVSHANADRGRRWRVLSGFLRSTVSAAWLVSPMVLESGQRWNLSRKFRHKIILPCWPFCVGVRAYRTRGKDFWVSFAQKGQRHEQDRKKSSLCCRILGNWRSWFRERTDLVVQRCTVRQCLPEWCILLCVSGGGWATSRFHLSRPGRLRQCHCSRCCYQRINKSLLGIRSAVRVGFTVTRIPVRIQWHGLQVHDHRPRPLPGVDSPRLSAGHASGAGGL